MKRKRTVGEHSLFFILLVIFLVVAIIDFSNADALLHQSLCTWSSQYVPLTCTDYYDLPIWEVYLSLAILAALYHVHAEIKTTNTHLKKS